MLEGLAAVVDGLVDTDVSELADAAIAGECVELQRQLDRLASYQARLVVAVQRRGIPNADGCASAATWMQSRTGQHVSDARAVHAATDAPGADDRRSLTKRQADALEQICRFFLDHQDLGDEDGEASHLTVTLDLETIERKLPGLGIDGPSLSAAQIEELLCDAQITRIILGSDRRPLAIGRARREPTIAQRRAVRTRDRGCRFPGCTRGSRRGRVHHVTHWELGGHTNVDELVWLCHYHHRVIHRPGWTNHFDGVTYTVTNPNGEALRGPPRLD